jgi:hypothetical protein
MEGLLLFGAYGLTFIQYHAYTHLCQPPELIYSQANPLAQRVAAHSVFKYAELVPYSSMHSLKLICILC